MAFIVFTGNHSGLLYDLFKHKTDRHKGSAVGNLLVL